MTHKIICICFNTSIDIRITVSKFSTGSVIKTSGYEEFAAGKAVNCARMLSCLGVPTSLFCFCGTADKTMFESISESIETHIVTSDHLTRRNITITNENADLICHLRNPGYSVTSETINFLSIGILENVSLGDIVIFSGSLPPGMNLIDFEEILKNISRCGGRIILDISAEWLKNLKQVEVELIKPNREELSEYVGHDLISKNSIIHAVQQLPKSKFVVVSLGEEGALWIDRSRGVSFMGSLTLGEAPLTDDVGCGDAMVGAIALGLSMGRSSAEILRMGIAAGASNLFAPGPGLIDVSRYRKMAELVEVTQFSE